MKTNKTAQVIKIPAMKKKQFKLTIIGTAPLMVQRFSEKAQRQIEEKQTKEVREKKKLRNPVKEFEDAAYRFKKGKKMVYGIPVMGLKKCAISAAKDLEGVTGAGLKRAFFIEADDVNGHLVEIKHKTNPIMDTRHVRLSGIGRTADLRYRPLFRDWACTFTVTYLEDVISPASIVALFERAGLTIGLCEYRVENSGNLGSFKVKKA